MIEHTFEDGETIWEEMKNDAYLPFKVEKGTKLSDGLFVIKSFVEALQKTIA